MHLLLAVKRDICLNIFIFRKVKLDFLETKLKIKVNFS